MQADAGMPASPLANRYAQAIYALAAEANAQERVADELAAVERLLRERRDLRDCILDPFLRAERKQAVVSELFGPVLLPLTLNFLRLLIDKRRAPILPEVARRVNELLRRSRGILAVRVTGAAPLTPVQTAVIRGRLSRIFKRQVEMETAEDPGLLGGIVIRAEFRLIDGSCRGQLENIRHELSRN